MMYQPMDEDIFVVRAHDITFSGTVRDWVARRLALGKNRAGDLQIREAQYVARKVEWARTNAGEVEPLLKNQDSFDLMIGRLDRILSLMMSYGKSPDLDLFDRQTLKHHAEDMIAAGEAILKRMKGVEGLPQPQGTVGVSK